MDRSASSHVRVPAGGSDAPRRATVTESDDYSRSVAGINIEVVRTGDGAAPTTITSVDNGLWAGSALDIGFQVFARTELSADLVGVAVIERAPPGMRWCGIDLSPGDVLVYAPEALHIAVHPQGAAFSFVVIPIEATHRIAAEADSAISLEKGSVVRMASDASSRHVRAVLPKHVGRTPHERISHPAERISHPTEDPVAQAVGHMLASNLRDTDTSASSRKLDNRVIVHTCIDHAERVKRIPTISELCDVSHVSERRLHYAFVETHHVPPHQFFLTWALDLARRRLTVADPEKVTVSWIAMGSGFPHLGRFARYYRKAYGESPSETLHRVEAPA